MKISKTTATLSVSIVALIVLYFTIVLLQWIAPSTRVMDECGDVSSGKLFAYSAAIFGVVFLVFNIFLMLSSVHRTKRW